MTNKPYQIRACNEKGEQTIQNIIGAELDSLCFIYHGLDSRWYVVEKKTGLSVVNDKTRKGALKKYDERYLALLDYIFENPYYKKKCKKFQELGGGND